MIELLDGRTFRRVAALQVPADIQFINVAFSPDGRVLVAMSGSASAGPLTHAARSTQHGRRIAPVLPIAPGVAGRLRRVRPRRALAAHPRGPQGDPAPTRDRSSTGVRSSCAIHGPCGPCAASPRLRSRAPLSPDGRTFAAGGDDGSVRFLDLPTGRLRTASGRHGPPSATRCSRPTGACSITVGEDAKAIVWDVRALAAVETLEGHAGPMIGAAVDPSAHTLCTSSGDGTVISWDLLGDRRLGRPFDVARTSGDWFVAAAISRDGSNLAMQQADGTVSLVDVATLRRAASSASRRGGASTSNTPAFGSARDAHRQRRRRPARSRRNPHRTDRVAPARPSRHGLHADDERRRDGSSPAPGRTTRCACERSLRPAARPADHARRRGQRRARDQPGRHDGRGRALRRHRRRLRRPHAPRRLARLRFDDSSPPSRASRATGACCSPAPRTAASASSRPTTGDRSAPRCALPPATSPASTPAPTAARCDRRHRRPDPTVGPTKPTPDRDGAPGPENRNAVAFFAPDGNHVLAVFANGRGYRWDVRPAAWQRQACTIADRRLTRAEWRAVLPDRPFAPAC